MINCRLIYLSLCFYLIVSIFAKVENAFSDDSVFKDHGIPVPIAQTYGTVATNIEGKGPFVLAWIGDYRGCTSLLSINTHSRKYSQINTPFSPFGDAPFVSILSSSNKFYTHFAEHFVEFNPMLQQFSCVRKVSSKTAMSLTEGDDGKIWVATYPNCGLFSFDPEKKEIRDYGSVNSEKWAQYPRYIATDKSGWVYIAVGYTLSQIIAVNPSTGKSQNMLHGSARLQGMAYLYRDVNGKVYGRALEDPACAIGKKTVCGSDGWYEFYEGQNKHIGQLKNCEPKEISAGRRGIYVRDLGDGNYIKDINTENNELTIENKSNGFSAGIHFKYHLEGAYIMSVATAADGSIIGGTAFPHYAFEYKPEFGMYTRHSSLYQWNVIVSHSEHDYIGGYPGGVLLDLSRDKTWYESGVTENQANPFLCGTAKSVINRPHDLIVSPDGSIVIMAGTPKYGTTGGGLLFYDVHDKQTSLLSHTKIIPDQSVKTMVVLNEKEILCGTTTSAGTGGIDSSDDARLFTMNYKTKEVIWSSAIIPGIKEYSELCSGLDGLVYGIADRCIFFIFDSTNQSVVKLDRTNKFGRVVYQQGTRMFIKTGKGPVYLLYKKGIAIIDKKEGPRWLHTSPVTITAGGDFKDGKIYFAGGSHLYSYKVLEAPEIHISPSIKK